jgi:TRAP-type C4-dicarboxylate transport system permease small subunit
VRRYLPVVITAVVLICFLVVAIKFMVDAWQHSSAVMSIHGWVALGLGVFFSIIIGCGLMALMFYSSRYGYDDRAQSTEYRRDAQRANDPQSSTDQSEQ